MKTKKVVSKSVKNSITSVTAHLKELKCVQGRNANKTGQSLEDFVEDTLVEKGAYAISYYKWANDQAVVPGWAKTVLYKQVHYKKPWGDTGRSDFVLESAKLGSIRIDARYQSVSGSVDEKACYLIECAEKCYPENKVIIVLDGPGVKPSIRSWLEAKAAAIRHKDVRIMTKTQFVVWANTEV